MWILITLNGRKKEGQKEWTTWNKTKITGFEADGSIVLCENAEQNSLRPILLASLSKPQHRSTESNQDHSLFETLDKSDQIYQISETCNPVGWCLIVVFFSSRLQLFANCSWEICILVFYGNTELHNYIKLTTSWLKEQASPKKVKF